MAKLVKKEVSERVQPGVSEIYGRNVSKAEIGRAIDMAKVVLQELAESMEAGDSTSILGLKVKKEHLEEKTGEVVNTPYVRPARDKVSVKLGEVLKRVGK